LASLQVCATREPTPITWYVRYQSHRRTEQNGTYCLGSDRDAVCRDVEYLREVAVGEAQVMVRALGASDGLAAVTVINTAAEWYAEFLPASEVNEPEMTLDSWAEEAGRMTWYGAFEGGELVAVMGLEYAGDAALLRHAYVLPDRQRQGIASMLHQRLERQVHGVDRIIVGTYTTNYKARQALEKAGYRPSPDPEAVLRHYYDIPEDRLQSSLTYEKHLDRDR
jgi:GNAT superfamily N-acetyltransferase